MTTPTDRAPEEARGRPPTPPKEKLCRACKFPMPVDANKCTKCSSLQNWRRYLDSSGIVLSLFVALASVLTFAIPIWRETLVPKAAAPAATLVEVDESGLATFVVTNGGNAPAVLEHIFFGTESAVVHFNLEPLRADRRVVNPNGINVFTVRLAIDNTVESVGELVKIFGSASGCALEVGLITPDGERTSAMVDSSSPGSSKPDDKECALKLRKLSTMTLEYLGNKSEYVATFCKVAELQRDPANPKVGSKCKK